MKILVCLISSFFVTGALSLNTRLISSPITLSIAQEQKIRAAITLTYATNKSEWLYALLDVKEKLHKTITLGRHEQATQEDIHALFLTTKQYEHCLHQAEKIITQQIPPEASPLASALSAALYSYFTVERAILSTYDNAVAFFVAQKKAVLPELLKTWQHYEEQLQALAYAKLDNEYVDIQALTALRHLLPLALDISFFMGESVAEKFFDEEDAKIYKHLNAEQITLRDTAITSQKEVHNAIQKSIQESSQTFSSNMQKLYKRRAISEELLSKNIAYLKREINLDAPQQHYVLYPQAYDQQFLAGRMPTTPVWYNVYQGLAGDWAFDEEFKGFVQRKLVEWQSVSQAQQNAIFTEYIPSHPYTVEIEMRLFNQSFPCFAGIMVNKARWLSGNTQRMFQARIIGCYAQQNDQGITMSLRYAQAADIVHQEDGTTLLKTPLEKIVDPTSILTTFSQDVTKKLLSDSATIIFETNLIENALTLSVYKKEEALKELLYRGKLTGTHEADNALSWYHSIGLLSPGCQTIFFIQQPVECATDATILHDCTTKDAQ